MSNIYAKAYAEVYEILKSIPEEDFEKIPHEVLNMLEEKKDKEYEFQLQDNTEFEDQCLLRETKVLLAIFYRDYWATEEEKEKIKQKWKSDIAKDEETKKLKHNIEIFKDTSTNNSRENINFPVEIKREKLFKRIISFIKEIIKIK